MGELAKLIGCRREETAREMPRPLACAAKWMVIQLTEVGNVGGRVGDVDEATGARLTTRCSKEERPASLPFAPT